MGFCRECLSGRWNGIRRREWLASCIGPVLGCVLAWLALWPLLRDGPAMGPDSVKYVSAARNLLRGEGVSIGTTPRTVPMTHWAPGYSVYLAGWMGLGLGFARAVTIGALVCYAALIWGVYGVGRQATGSAWAAAGMAACVGLHPSVLRVGVAGLSEPLSWVWWVLGLRWALGLGEGGAGRGWRQWALGFWLGLGVLVRYAFAGLALGMVVAMGLLAGRHRGFRQGAAAAARAGMGVLGPPAIWWVRNRLSGFGASGGTASGTLLGNAARAVGGLGTVLTGRLASGGLGKALVLACVLCVAAICALEWVRKSDGRWGCGRGAAHGPAGCGLCLYGAMGMFGYMALLVLLRTWSARIVFDDRMFSALVVPWVATGVGTMRLVAAEAGGRCRRVAGCAMLLLTWGPVFGSLPAGGVFADGVDRGYGAMGRSEMMRRALDMYSGEKIACSDPEVFWLWRDVPCRYLPCADGRASAWPTRTVGSLPLALPDGCWAPLRASRALPHVRVLAWYRGTFRRYVIQPEQVEWDVPHRKIELSDGVLYELLPPDDSGNGDL